MTKKICHIIPLLYLFALTALCSCGEDRWAAYEHLTAHNQWIDSLMREQYYWSDKLPKSKELTQAYFGTAQEFLAKIKNAADHVSYAEDESSAPATDYGCAISLLQSNEGAYMGLITHVEPLSPAGKAGLRRGDWILQIDGADIDNPSDNPLSDGKQHNLLMGKRIVDAEGQEGLTPSHSILLPAASTYTHCTIALDSTYQTTKGLVGYVVCNRLDSEAIPHIAAAAKHLSAKNVQHLILDLRNCNTGNLEGMQHTASIIAHGSTLAHLHYTNHLGADTTLPFLNTEELNGTPQLNLQSLYVLTSESTAGMAEILTNCLKPHIATQIVGERTQGIAMSTQTFSNPLYGLRVHLASCRVTDANDQAEYEQSGLTPDVELPQFGNLSGVLPLGDVKENLLAKALELIQN